MYKRTNPMLSFRTLLTSTLKSATAASASKWISTAVEVRIADRDLQTERLFILAHLGP